jgi:putative SOS response-associated peptidase YedK
MCNLYSVTKGQAAIRELARAMRDQTGNLPLIPGVFPDYSAPIVRTALDGVRELAMARWGMPSPAFALKGKKTDPGVTWTCFGRMESSRMSYEELDDTAATVYEGI